jgi:SAM-dependent methyltransferase
MSSSHYVGGELDVFAQALNWKAYLRQLIGPYLRGRVLEVGAGIGATTCVFRDDRQSSWMALEPDERLAEVLRSRVADAGLTVDVRVGDIRSLAEREAFDTVLYVDVLEHIADDRGELERAVARIVSGGAVVVMSPAHQALYSPFDAAIGHHRRYDREQIARLQPEGLRLQDVRYLDSVGLVLSAGNRLWLKSATPTLSQVLFWDRWCVPVSRTLDRLTFGRLGKSILAVWRKP